MTKLNFNRAEFGLELANRNDYGIRWATGKEYNIKKMKKIQIIFWFILVFFILIILLPKKLVN